MAKYRIKHSETDTHIVYRKFTYERQKQLGLIGFLAVVLMSVGIFLLIPTPEDILTIGAIANFLAGHYALANGKSIFYALILYKGSGALIVLAAIVLGGAYIKNLMLAKIGIKNQR